MNDPAHHEWHRLFSAALNGIITDAEKAQLATLLKTSAEARHLWFVYHDNECGLAELKQRLAVVAPLPSPAARSRWLSWRPLAAAAAGVVLGLFCGSVAWAYVMPRAGRAMSLLQESFESGPAPLVAGVPVEPGLWGGDYSEITGGQQGVQPQDGKRMLRFLRGDYDGRAIPGSHSSDVFRLVDVRPFRREFADGSAVVQATALFNAAASVEDDPFYCTLTIFALDAATVNRGPLNSENFLSRESLAFSRSSRLKLDRAPATWQKVSNELRVPPETDFLMVRMGVSNDSRQPGQRTDSFAGHYADQMQMLLARRPEIPVP